MTLREVHIALTQIDIRTHNNLAAQARFHGFKMKFKVSDRREKENELSVEDSMRVDEAMFKAIEDLKNRKAEKRING